MNHAHMVNTLHTWRDECISRGLPEQAAMFDGLAMLTEMGAPIDSVALAALVETAAS